jgi:hypothetical protein
VNPAERAHSVRRQKFALVEDVPKNSRQTLPRRDGEQTVLVPPLGRPLQVRDVAREVPAIRQKPVHPLLEAGQAFQRLGLENLHGEERNDADHRSRPHRHHAAVHVELVVVEAVTLVPEAGASERVHRVLERRTLVDPSGKRAIELAIEVRPRELAFEGQAKSQYDLASGGHDEAIVRGGLRPRSVLPHRVAPPVNVMKPFAFAGLGKMGSLGHQSAVAEILGIPVSGFFAWFLWRTIYLMKIPGWGRRLKIAVSWTLDLFLPPELVQLKLASSVGVTQEHFEPGQEVFHQGDVGDRIYIIVSGTVEIVRDDHRVATLGRGDFFGETALLLQAQRSATVRCLEPADLLALPKREFSILSAHLPELRRSFEAKSEERARTDGAAPS